MYRSRMTRVLILASTVGALMLATAGMAGAVTVNTIPGEGWTLQEANTAGGHVRLVEGPQTPPEGRGSLEFKVSTESDRAVVENLLADAFTFKPFETLSAASWSTFVLPGESNHAAPSLRFAAFMHPDAADPVASTGFMTVNVEPFVNGTVTDGVWQPWHLNDETMVWQTNRTATTFCFQASPCTFAEFKTHFPAAAFYNVQLGVGSGAPAAISYADALTLVSAGTEFTYNFEIPPG